MKIQTTMFCCFVSCFWMCGCERTNEDGKSSEATRLLSAEQTALAAIQPEKPDDYTLWFKAIKSPASNESGQKSIVNGLVLSTHTMLIEPSILICIITPEQMTTLLKELAKLSQP